MHCKVCYEKCENPPPSVIPAQAGIQIAIIVRNKTMKQCYLFRHCEECNDEAIQNIFSIPFVSLSLKGLVTIFLEQARKKQRTCHAVVSSFGYPRIFVLLRRCGTQLLQATTSNKSSRFILAKSKIHRRHKCVGLRINYYCIASPFSMARNDGENRILLSLHPE
jgi:hypothetical protein